MVLYHHPFGDDMKYRKKPIIVDAYQTSIHGGKVEMPVWLHDAMKKDTVYREGGRLYIKTLEGVMVACPGDYIIKGIRGELYPCRPDIFEATYEEVTPSRESG